MLCHECSFLKSGPSHCSWSPACCTPYPTNPPPAPACSYHLLFHPNRCASSFEYRECLLSDFHQWRDKLLEMCYLRAFDHPSPRDFIPELNREVGPIKGSRLRSRPSLACPPWDPYHPSHCYRP